jgi:hypothetical protein
MRRTKIKVTGMSDIPQITTGTHECQEGGLACCAHVL